MPRYAIKPARAWSTLYTEADDALDAVNWARRVLIDQAKKGELDIVRLPDTPYDEGDARSEARLSCFCARLNSESGSGPSVTECDHDWKRVPPVVTPIGLPAFAGVPSEQLPTYNAECETCGEKAWLNWPEQRYKW